MPKNTYITKIPGTRQYYFDDDAAKHEYIENQIELLMLSGHAGGYEIDKDGLAEVLPGRLKIGHDTAIEWTLEAIDVFESKGFDIEVKLK